MQSTIVRSIVSVHRFHEYFTDKIYIPLIWIWRSKRRGMAFGDCITWFGCPIVSMTAGSSIRIGENCVICSRSKQTALGVNHPVILRTLRPGAELKIGHGVRMSGTTICAARRVIIGERCVIGANATIVDTDFHSLNANVRSTKDDFASTIAKPVEIGSDVFIGGGSYILKGVTVGKGAIIGAASVVTRDVASYSVVAGNPAREIARRPADRSS